MKATYTVFKTVSTVTVYHYEINCHKFSVLPTQSYTAKAIAKRAALSIGAKLGLDMTEENE